MVQPAFMTCFEEAHWTGSSLCSLCGPDPFCPLCCTVCRNVEGAGWACCNSNSSKHNGDCVCCRGRFEAIFDCTGVDVVVHPTGSRISRVRYDTRSDRDNKVREIVSLCQLKPGEKGEVVEVKRAEKNALQRLLAMG